VVTQKGGWAKGSPQGILDLTPGATEGFSDAMTVSSLGKWEIALDASRFGPGNLVPRNKGCDLLDHMCLTGMSTAEMRL
jgi:hypothetical protein